MRVYTMRRWFWPIADYLESRVFKIHDFGDGKSYRWRLFYRYAFSVLSWKPLYKQETA